MKHFGLIKQNARGLRYRELPDLVGKKVKIEDLAKIDDKIRSVLPPDLKPGQLETEPTTLAKQVGKYGLIDIEYLLPNCPSHEIEIIGLRKIFDLHLWSRRSEVDEEDSFDEEFAIVHLEEALNDILQDRIRLKLFLNVIHRTPIKNWQSQFYQEPANAFPNTFTIEDAALTNDPSIWLEKHFYL